MIHRYGLEMGHGVTLNYGAVLINEQARKNFRFSGDWAPEETAITSAPSSQDWG
jgi:hypothetical protein